MVSQELMPTNYLDLHPTVWCCQEQFGLGGWLSQDESSFKGPESQNPKQGGGGRSEWHTTEREGEQQTEVGGLCSETGLWGNTLNCKREGLPFLVRRQDLTLQTLLEHTR